MCLLVELFNCPLNVLLGFFGYICCDLCCFNMILYFRHRWLCIQGTDSSNVGEEDKNQTLLSNTQNKEER